MLTYDPSEPVMCCTCAQFIMNSIAVLWLAYVGLLVGAWIYWDVHLPDCKSTINEWHNAVLTSVVWFNVAQCLVFVLALAFMRLQRSTLKMVPNSRKAFRKLRDNDDDKFEITDIEKEFDDFNKKRSKPRANGAKHEPEAATTDVQIAADTEEDRQIDAILSAATTGEVAVAAETTTTEPEAVVQAQTEVEAKA